MSTAPNNKPAPKTEAKSSADGIECTVRKAFFDDNMRFNEVGKPYVYFPVEDRPFPWPLLEPDDKALHSSLRKEYEDERKAKLAEISQRRDRRLALDRLASK